MHCPWSLSSLNANPQSNSSIQFLDPIPQSDPSIRSLNPIPQSDSRSHPYTSFPTLHHPPCCPPTHHCPAYSSSSGCSLFPTMITLCSGGPNSSSDRAASSSSVPEMIRWVGVPIRERERARVFEGSQRDRRGVEGGGDEGGEEEEEGRKMGWFLVWRTTRLVLEVEDDGWTR